MEVQTAFFKEEINKYKKDNKKRIIMHLDLDAFYAGCEEARNPKLRNKIVVIGSDPKEGKGRGVVSTANYFAREYGVRSALPISWAYKKLRKAGQLKNTRFLSVDMKYYIKISRRIFHQIKEIIGTKGIMQRASIDEAYMDVSYLKTFDKAKKLALKIKKELYLKEKITCSIGISTNKLISKIASDYKKPNAITIVKDDRIISFLSELSIRKIPGIGKKAEESLNKIGIKKVNDLQKVDAQKLMSKYTKAYALHLKQLAYGISFSEVSEFSQEAKSRGAERTFMKDLDCVNDKEKILTTIDKLTKMIYDSIKKYNKNFRTITIKVRYENFETHTKQKSAKIIVSNLKEARNISQELIKSFLKKGRKIRLIGVSLSKFS